MDIGYRQIQISEAGIAAGLDAMSLRWDAAHQRFTRGVPLNDPYFRPAAVPPLESGLPILLRIVAAACRHYRVDPATMVSQRPRGPGSRHAPVVKARAAIMTLATRHTGLRPPAIGQRIGIGSYAHGYKLLAAAKRYPRMPHDLAAIALIAGLEP